MKLINFLNEADAAVITATEYFSYVSSQPISINHVSPYLLEELRRLGYRVPESYSYMYSAKQIRILSKAVSLRYIYSECDPHTIDTGDDEVLFLQLAKQAITEGVCEVIFSQDFSYEF